MNSHGRVIASLYPWIYCSFRLFEFWYSVDSILSFIKNPLQGLHGMCVCGKWYMYCLSTTKFLKYNCNECIGMFLVVKVWTILCSIFCCWCVYIQIILNKIFISVTLCFQCSSRWKWILSWLWTNKVMLIHTIFIVEKMSSVFLVKSLIPL